MKYNKFLRYWLLLGCVLIFFQIVIGGITRITGSGLSITKWEIVTGTLPPMNEVDWNKEFDLYKETPQYKKINQGMSMKDFKFIYFWEYFHRLWARMMGFIFLIPLCFFIYKKYVDRKILKHLTYVFLSAAAAALFGWIMVASGLVDRPWVNAYKLSLHLGIALLTFALVWWLYLYVTIPDTQRMRIGKFRSYAHWFFIFLIVQIFFGAVVSGMRASLYYPTWPDMNGEYIASILFERSTWSLEGIVDYDKDSLMPAMIHVLHRNWAYVVYFFGLFISYKILKYPFRRKIHVASILMIIFLNLQVFLGIMVLVNSKETIPVFYGVMHQAIAIFIFSLGLFNLYIFQKAGTAIADHEN